MAKFYRGKKFYRYEFVTYASLDNDTRYTEHSIPNPKIILQEFTQMKETDKGYWIGLGNEKLHGGWRWVSKTAKKRYAYPTKQEAMTNFIKRTERRVKILQTNIDICKAALYDAKNMKL